jgi:hypothetical protein
MKVSESFCNVSCKKEKQHQQQTDNKWFTHIFLVKLDSEETDIAQKFLNHFGIPLGLSMGSHRWRCEPIDKH